jgi:hypothetical protein
MFNPDFRVFGLRVYLRNKDSMLCPVPTAAPLTQYPDTTTSTVTPHFPNYHQQRRPSHTRSPAFPAAYSTLKPPSYDDTIILDDIIRERGNAASSHRPSLARVCAVALTLLGLHVLLARCFVGRPLCTFSTR